MSLLTDVCKFIKHKERVADHSAHYMYIPRLQALQFAHSLLQLFSWQKQYLTDYDVARQVLQNKQHLQMILPHELNKSYKTSVAALERILQEATDILNPKTNGQDIHV